MLATSLNDKAPKHNPEFTGTVTIPDGALSIDDVATLKSILDSKAGKIALHPTHPSLGRKFSTRSSPGCQSLLRRFDPRKSDCAQPFHRPTLRRLPSNYSRYT